MMAVKHSFEPSNGLHLSHYEEASLSAELKTFIDSSDTRNLLQQLILDDQCLLTQVDMVHEVGSPQATDRETLVQPQPIECHRPEKTQSAMGALAHSPPAEATNGACQENARLVTAAEVSPRSAPSSFDYQPKKRYPATRKKKTVFTDHQVELLEMTFSTSHYPSSVLRQQLSYVSGISPQIILTWFQNRRVRYRRKKDQKTSQGHPSNISSEKQYPFVKSTSASDDSKESKLPANSQDECIISHLKSACWPTHPVAQSVGVAFPSPDHMLNDGQPQAANFQQKYNHVYPSSQPNSQLEFPLTNSHSAQHHHTKPWYSSVNSQRMNQCMLHYQSNRTEGQLHCMPSSADWPKKNCTVSYQQPNTQWCFTNNGNNLHPTTHFTQEATFSEENCYPLQGYPYQYFPLRYPGASQTSIHSWDMISQHSRPSYHQQQVITPSETQLLHMNYDNHSVFPIVQRPPGNQPDMLDVTQGTLPSQHYLHPEDLPTFNSKPHQQTINEYSSSGDSSYSENFKEYPSMDPFKIEVSQMEYTRAQGCQPLHVPTTQSLFRSQTSSFTQVATSDQRQVSIDTASPAASPAMTESECSFASHSLYIDLDVHSDVDYQ